MLEFIIVLLVIHFLQGVTVGYKTVITPQDVEEPKVKDFESLDDAMEYAELRRGGWKGDVDDFYELKCM